MNSVRKSAQLIQLARNISRSAVRQSETEVASGKFKSMKERQNKFQIDDGVPVHIKAGTKDKLLYQITALLTAIGLGLSCQVLYKLSYPKKD